MSKNKSNMYTVFWVGGDRDGEILGTTLTEGEAINMARKLYDEHEDEFHPTWGGFHPTWGGIGIVAPDGSDVEW